MKYLSICSGIEAATVAWKPLGWEAIAYSEIEPFPCSLLQHHYPNTPNYGDMTTYEQWPIDRESVELICGGTPCQDFSVAGKRAGMDGARGNLTRVFVDLVDYYKPRWVVWENVPGLLSSNEGRDFGAFIGALAECGYGVCYRILDAQYFGVPQRRRRVWVVGYLGDWRPAWAVLSQRESLLRDLTPRREKREDAPAAVAACINSRSGMPDRGDTGHNSQLVTEYWNGADVTNSLTCRNAGGGQRMPDKDNFQAVVTHSLKSRHDGSEDGTGRVTPIVAQQVQWASGGGKIMNDTAQALRSGAEHNYQFVAEPVAFSHIDNGRDAGDISPTLRSCSSSHVSITTQMRVRRLTPRECERLQGFPDDYTAVPHRGKPASDSARYKALGNSWAVPCARWIGERIQMFEDLNTKIQKEENK
ncbi:MAG: DNA cytosine methyltransferase [FCB group bacterium]|nr:DNA cytosine methyltransferase [FCB group bacterium]